MLRLESVTAALPEGHTGGTISSPQLGLVIVTVSVVTVPPNAKARPVQEVPLPTVIPAGSMSVPLKVLLAPKVVAAVGVQNTLQAEAPPESATTLGANRTFKGTDIDP